MLNRRTVAGALVAGLVASAISPTVLARSLPTHRQSRTQPDFPIGVTLYVKGEDAGDRAAVRRLLDARRDAGDNAICLVIPFTQDHATSSDPRPDDAITPTLADLRYLTRQATARGLAVMYKPLMDERHLMAEGAWRGSIAPENPDLWFERYTALLAPWVELAGEENASWFVIGSEFSSLETEAYDRAWMELIDTTRDMLGNSGVGLTYGQNWDRVSAPPAWFETLDLLSIDAYYPLHGVDDGSPVTDLVAAFEEHSPLFVALRERFPGKPVYFTEVGISSQSGVYDAPWTWSDPDSSTLNLESQRTFLEASCDYYGRVGDGLFWWVADIHPLDDPLADTGFQFIGKPAEDAVNTCSAALSDGHEEGS